jgi:phage terminase Nu1 subunit (DNA packaging protein)
LTPVALRGRSGTGEDAETKDMRNRETTIAPIEAGDFANSRKEFGRTKDVEHVFSIKRGSLYNAEKLGLVKGVLLRLQGQKSGVKLWDMRSVEEWIRNEMQVSQGDQHEPARP